MVGRLRRRSAPAYEPPVMRKPDRRLDVRNWLLLALLLALAAFLYAAILFKIGHFGYGET